MKHTLTLLTAVLLAPLARRAPLPRLPMTDTYTASMKPSLPLLTALLLAPLAMPPTTLQGADDGRQLIRLDEPAAREGPPPDRQWKLVFSDEFDGAAIDESRWKSADTTDWDHPGFKTRQAKENCALDGQGRLAIRLTRDPDGTIVFNHGLQTRDFQKAFGYVETRVQFSTQPGWWGSVYLIRNNTLRGYGHHPFENPQEFDVFEDVPKPKIEPSRSATGHNVISQGYHCTFGVGFQDQGDGTGASTRAKWDMLAVKKTSHVYRQARHAPREYAGWHTVGLRFVMLGGDGVRLQGTNVENVISGNEIRETGGAGVVLVSRDKTGNSGDTKDFADQILLRGHSSRYPKLVRNVISDNDIHHCGRLKKNCGGVQFYGINSSRTSFPITSSTTCPTRA
ncbi:MAG TPA: glycoside hydrolase family 16 protein [Thermoguttaceae bacterium]|nr:glycoside hydrolase family 16 protein [Thermoguttaceae bacterium]HUU94693.1 glycoside hydrolase family 16 protein [Phycisphaerae bacterium]